VTSKLDYFRNNIHDPEARAAWINALSSGDDSEDSESSDEQAAGARKGR